MKDVEISKQVVEYILTRKIEDLRNLTGAEIARNLEIEKSDLFRSFEDNHQIALQDFILREKMYRAFCILRKNYGKSIEQLSKELGFLKVADFDIEFNRYFAIDPEVYRNLLKQVHEKLECI